MTITKEKNKKSKNSSPRQHHPPLTKLPQPMRMLSNSRKQEPVRLGNLPNTQRIGARSRPLIETLGGDLNPRRLGREALVQALEQILVDECLLVPSAQALVGPLEQLRVPDCNRGSFGYRQVVFLVVLGDDLTENSLVQGHGGAVVVVRGVEFREQRTELESASVQRAPDTTQIVADIAAEADGLFGLAA